MGLMKVRGMEKDALMNELNRRYPVIGLSADWIYQA